MNHRPLPEGVRTADAEHFIFTHARLLERRRLEHFLHGGGPEGVLAALAAYRNPDGGFGHALEPDVRAPGSEPLATLTALDLLAGLGLSEHPWVRAGLEWAAAESATDGSVPFVSLRSGEWPHAPWAVPSPGGSQLTFGYAAAALRTGFEGGWVQALLAWCGHRLEAGDLAAYEWKYALRFLTALESVSGAMADLPALTPLRRQLEASGLLPVEGGAEGEGIHVVDLLADPWTGLRPAGAAARAASAAVLSRDLHWLAAGQQPDGGWTVDWPAWCPAAGMEWRGIRTLEALEILSALADRD